MTLGPSNRTRDKSRSLSIVRSLLRTIDADRFEFRWPVKEALLSRRLVLRTRRAVSPPIQNRARQMKSALSLAAHSAIFSIVRHLTGSLNWRACSEAKLSNRGKYSLASRRFGLLPREMDPCSLTTTRCWLHWASWFLGGTPHRNRRGAHWCFRWHGSSAPRQKLLACICPVPMPAKAPRSMCLFEPSSC